MSGATVDAAGAIAGLQRFATDLKFGVRGYLQEAVDGAAEHARRYPHLFQPRTGTLQRAMGAHLLMSGGSVERAVLDVRTPYAHPLYDGSRAHEIRPRRAKMLRFVKNGEIIFARKVDHPGNSARPFFDDAAGWGKRQLLGQLDALVSRLATR